MGLFSFLKKNPKNPAKQNEFVQWVFPNGEMEKQFKGRITADIGNGKLNLDEAILVYFAAKFNFKIACTEFDGVQKLGPSAEKLVEVIKTASKNILSTMESVNVLHYVIFDKTDSSLETFAKIQQFLVLIYGSKGVGCESDEIPLGIGEFGFDQTNPIPVRGLASNAIYLNQLKTSDGCGIEFRRVQSLVVPNFEGRVDEFEISQNRKVLCSLFLHPYNQRISHRPPKGFILLKKD